MATILTPNLSRTGFSFNTIDTCSRHIPHPGLRNTNINVGLLLHRSSDMYGSIVFKSTNSIFFGGAKHIVDIFPRSSSNLFYDNIVRWKSIFHTQHGTQVSLLYKKKVTCETTVERSERSERTDLQERVFLTSLTRVQHEHDIHGVYECQKKKKNIEFDIPGTRKVGRSRYIKSLSILKI